MTRQTDETINRIRTHTLDQVATKPGDKRVTIPAILDMLERLERLVKIDDNAPSAIDGYPTKTPGAAPSDTIARIELNCVECGAPEPCREHGLRRLHTGEDGKGPAYDNHPTDLDHELGHNRTDSTTVVERSTLELVQRGNPRDVVHLLRVEAEEAAEKAAAELTKLAGALARYDNLQTTLPPGTPQCFVASVIHHLNDDVAWIPGKEGRRTRFDGVISIPWREERLVCRWVYDFTRRWRRLPTKDEMLEYLRTGYVLINETREGRRAS